MMKVREVLRLKFNLGLSNEKIAQSIGIGETTVREYLIRTKNAEITWPLPEGLCDKSLEEALYPVGHSGNMYEKPRFEYIHQELKKQGVTLLLLWEDYKESNPKYFCYSQFCRLYRDWRSCSDTWMIQSHKAGESTFMDWAGNTMPIYNRQDGSIAFKASIYVSALGASSYTFCVALKNQQTPNLLDGHKQMNEYYGGVTETWVFDNPKTAITKANRYEPDFQEDYNALAKHYGVALLPARVRRPQDKSRAEDAVYLVETAILAPLRNERFFSLEELNAAIRIGLETLNHKPFQKMPGSSRFSLYCEIDKPALRPLPDVPYEIFLFGRETLNRGYHIYIEGIPYSVPHKLVGKRIESRYNERVVEFFYDSQRVAIHQRSFEIGIPVTNPDHQPVKHQKQAECTPENVKEQAQAMGESVFAWVCRVLENTDVHPKQRLNTALGVVRLSKSYSFSRINAACLRGLYYHNFLYKGVKDMLERGLDSLSLPTVENSQRLPQNHSNIRGPGYYI